MLKAIDNQGHQLALEAADAWLRLVASATAAGHTVLISTAYRDAAEQRRLYQNYVHAVADWERGGRMGQKPTPVAMPGSSKHESGLAVDVHVAAYPQLLAWLRLNAAAYGFKETVSREPWHWEYVR